MTGGHSGQLGAPSSLAEHREQLALLSRTLEREAHILLREPEVLSSHLHNMLYLEEGEEGPGERLGTPISGRNRALDWQASTLWFGGETSG